MASGGFRSLVGRPVGGLSGTAAPTQPGGFRSLFGRWMFGLSGSTTPPPPPPPPSEAVGGWTYDPYSRRRKIKRDDEEQIPVPPPAIVPPAPYQPPAVDLAALDRQIAALEARIKESRRGRTKLRAEAARLQLERDMHARFERHRKLMADDDEWFLLN